VVLLGRYVTRPLLHFVARSGLWLIHLSAPPRPGRRGGGGGGRDNFIQTALAVQRA
ncbi:hypothetical protein I5L38_19180, partial [Serratia marcescens]|nr:hypothetical protein [Serratia marcescens]